MIRLPRVPIGALMLGVGFVALDCALIREFFSMTKQRSVGAVFLTIPALVAVISVLLFQVAVRLPRLWRTGRATGSFVVGFQFATWGALAGLMAVSLSLPRVQDWYFDGVGLIAFPILEALFETRLWPDWLGFAVEFIYFAAILGGPVLAVGLIGGGIARWLGIVVEVRVGRAGRSAAEGGG